MDRDQPEKSSMSNQSSQGNRKLASKRGNRARSVTEVLGSVLEPIMARRAGMRIDLMRAWPELSGPDYAEVTRPEKIKWPRRISDDDPFKAGVLVVACEPASAVFFEHEKSAVVERVNMFFGFEAVNRLVINQKPVRLDNRDENASVPMISDEDSKRLKKLLGEIDDPELRQALERLGIGVLGSK